MQRHMQLNKEQLAAAMGLNDYDQWRPAFDVPGLNRPRHRPIDLPGMGRFAAVLLLVFPSLEGDLRLILTRRQKNMSKHPGQIALPGGRQDPGETLEQTALRETSEEIGVKFENIQILGDLNSVYVPPSDFTVTPFVGWHEGTPKLRAAEDEVAEILEVPVSNLLDPDSLNHGEVITWNQDDPSSPHKIIAPYFSVGQHQVWGATAVMLGEFLDRLRRTISRNST